MYEMGAGDLYDEYFDEDVVFFAAPDPGIRLHADSTSDLTTKAPKPPVSPPAPMARKHFPETWIWKLLPSG